jgi:hypothetical protein
VFFLLLAADFFIRPFCALIDPGAYQSYIFIGKRAAQRHARQVSLSHDPPHDEARLRVAGNDRRARHSAFEGKLFFVETQLTGNFTCAVTGVAMPLKDGVNIAYEIYFARGFLRLRKDRKA